MSSEESVESSDRYSFTSELTRPVPSLHAVTVTKETLPGVALAGPTTEDTHRSGLPDVAAAPTTESRKSSAGPGPPREHPATTALAISRVTHQPC